MRPGNRHAYTYLYKMILFAAGGGQDMFSFRGGELQKLIEKHCPSGTISMASALKRVCTAIIRPQATWHLMPL